MSTEPLILGNKINDTEKKNQTKASLGPQCLYTLEKNLTLIKRIRNKLIILRVLYSEIL